MKIFKNLFGDNNSKIHVDEVAIKQGDKPTLLSAAVIVESGSNSNGDYLKFGDGTLICWHVDTDLKTASDEKGGIYRTDSLTWTFPVKFISPPNVTGSSTTYAGLGWFGNIANITETKANFRLFSLVSYTDTPYANTHLRAIGKWK